MRSPPEPSNSSLRNRRAGPDSRHSTGAVLDILLYDSGPDANNGLPKPVVTPDQTAAETMATQQPLSDPQPKRPRWLKVGSDVEVARYVKTELMHDYGSVPHWSYRQILVTA